GIPRTADRLEKELARICANAPAIVGATFHHLETGREASINGEQLFPMASTLKIPLAVHILALVDEGKLKLEEVVTLEAEDVYAPTWGPICTFFRPGSVLTVRDLIAVMMMDSDNNATDVLYRIGGGPSAVKARMRSHGLAHIHNDRPISVLLANHL